jgi:branched-chain amino acid aminotransferase
MKECTGNIYIRNGNLVPASGFSNSLLLGDQVFYEVFRVMGSVPVFLEEHYERLIHSLKQFDRTFNMRYTEFRDLVDMLISEEDTGDGNIKISVVFRGSGSEFFIYYIDSQYPTADQYSKGVKVILYQAERTDPTAKIFNQGLRNSVFTKLMSTGAYEALLVNVNDCITEGSRSNIFFISRNNEIITAPDDTVLNGITRKKVLDIMAGNDFCFQFRCLHTRELSEISSAFLTGTSPGVLPVMSVDNIDYDTGNPELHRLMVLYNNMILEHLSKF